METYKKIKEDILEVTNLNTNQESRQQLEEEKQEAERQKANIQKWLDKIDIKLAALDEI